MKKLEARGAQKLSLRSNVVLLKKVTDEIGTATQKIQKLAGQVPKKDASEATAQGVDTTVRSVSGASRLLDLAGYLIYFSTRPDVDAGKVQDATRRLKDVAKSLVKFL